ncbi:MAG TPA: hypothetical protein VFZ25_11425 [Chloroflexota bacterium]|nr:hypothetical protein [Chloroflexota bacterium]
MKKTVSEAPKAAPPPVPPEASRAFEPSKRPVPREGGLRYGMDIDGTITSAPRHFKRIIDALVENGDTVYILTARPESRRRQTVELLKRLSIRYHELLMRPDDWAGTVPEYKVAMVTEKEMHLTIDDEEANCWAINESTMCLAAHMLPFPTIHDDVNGGAE